MFVMEKTLIELEQLNLHVPLLKTGTVILTLLH